MKTAWSVVIDTFFTFLFFVLPQSTFAQLKINEVFANPVNEDDEFIELYNPTDQAIDISGYKLSDLTNKPYTITETAIDPKSFFTVKQTAFKFQLNNTGQEMVTLKDGSEAIADSFSYDGTSEGFSFSRIPDGGNWLAITTPSENSGNIAPPSPNPSPSPSPSPSPAALTISSQSATASPSPAPTPSASPQPSRAARVKDIVLLNLETPAPILGTSSSQPAKPVDWQLISLLLATGTGLLAATAIIMIKLWRKS